MVPFEPVRPCVTPAAVCRQRCSVSGQVLVVLLNGQKLELGCQMDTHTVADVTKVGSHTLGWGEGVSQSAGRSQLCRQSYKLIRLTFLWRMD